MDVIGGKLGVKGHPVFSVLTLAAIVQTHLCLKNEEIDIVTTQPINENEEFETTLTPILRFLNYF